MKLPVVFAAFALFAAPALAAPPADGCGGMTTVPSPDDTGASVLFSSMVVGIDQPAVACSVATPLSAIPLIPDTPSDAILAYSADYRIDGQEGDQVTLTVDEEGVVHTVTTDVSADPDKSVILHTYVTPGSDSKFNADVLFELLGGDDASNSELTSIDYGFLGFTTRDEQNASLAQVASAQTAVVTHLNTTVGLIVGADQPLERRDQVGLIGAIGSYTVGVTGHVNLGDGFSIDGGAALFEQSVGGANSDGVLLGGKASYLQPENGSSFRLLGNVGVSATPNMNMSFSRDYTLFGAGDDFADVPVSATASGNGTMVGMWVEGGVLVAPDPSNDIIFTASYARNWVNFASISEKQTDANPFALSFDNSTSTYDTVKAKAAWTTKITSEVDLSLHVAVGQIFAGDVTGDVALAGPLTVGGQDETFAEYGIRADWNVTEAAQLGLFALGSTGSETGTHFQVGTAASLKF